MCSNKSRIKTYELIVSGRVQGVGFRWFVRGQAQEYGFKGTVRNLYDGTVRIKVQGDFSQLDSFILSLRIGNGYSIIELITKTELHTEKVYGGFRIEH